MPRFSDTYYLLPRDLTWLRHMDNHTNACSQTGFFPISSIGKENKLLPKLFFCHVICGI